MYQLDDLEESVLSFCDLTAVLEVQRLLSQFDQTKWSPKLSTLKNHQASSCAIEGLLSRGAGQLGISNYFGLDFQRRLNQSSTDGPSIAATTRPWSVATAYEMRTTAHLPEWCEISCKLTFSNGETEEIGPLSDMRECAKEIAGWGVFPGSVQSLCVEYFGVGDNGRTARGVEHAVEPAQKTEGAEQRTSLGSFTMKVECATDELLTQFRNELEEKKTKHDEEWNKKLYPYGR